MFICETASIAALAAIDTSVIFGVNLGVDFGRFEKR